MSANTVHKKISLNFNGQLVEGGGMGMQSSLTVLGMCERMHFIGIKTKELETKCYWKMRKKHPMFAVVT